MRKLFIPLAIIAFMGAMSYAQAPADAQSSAAQSADAQSGPPQMSLGDYARQQRLKKQQHDAQLQQAKANKAADTQRAEAAAETPPKTAHIVTKDETPERATVTEASVRTTSTESQPQPGTSDRGAQGETWKSQILAQKQAVAALEQDIKSVGDSIHFAGANCVANCAQWNEHQQQKQQEVETMKAQLEEQKKTLEDMQDQARKAGFGSANH